MRRGSFPACISPLWLIVGFLLVASTTAQADQIDDYVKAEVEKQKIVGLSLAVVKEGKIIKAQGYGWANVELNIPARPETVYKIGSVSKQFIAAGIMLLMEEGKLRLEDKVSRYLEGTPMAWREITLHHLLTHTSGIAPEAPGFDPLKLQNDADVIKTAYAVPLKFSPGEQWDYCNVGYFILAEVMRKVTGEPWESFLEKRLFLPSGMKATRTTTMKEIVPNRASGYERNQGTLQNEDYWFAVRPSGAFLSTVLDLAKWDAVLYTNNILSQKSRAQMWQPLVKTTLSTGQDKAPFYGLGWEVDEINGHRRIFHSGTLTGFKAFFMRFVDDNLTVAVLANTAQVNPGRIAEGVAGYYIAGLSRVSAKSAQ